MCRLSELQPTELTAMSRAQIIAEIFKGVMRSTRSREEDEHGRAVRQVETITDAYGNLLGTRQTLWTYYDPGVVNVITMQEFDEKNKLLGGYTVKHFRDEKPPILNPIKGEAPG